MSAPAPTPARWRYPAALDRQAVKVGGFPEFVRVAYEAFEKTRYVPTWHVGACARIIEARWHVDISDTILNLPPSHTKTTLFSLFQIYVWATKDPGHRFFFGSYSGELGKREAGKMVALLNDQGFRERWPELRLVDAKAAETSDPNTSTLTTSAGGMRFANTPRGAGTGWHFDTHIYDDMHKASELSKKTLDLVNGWLTTTLASRWRGSRRCRMLGMQRLHVNDASAVIEEQATNLLRVILPLEFDPKLAARRKLTPEEIAIDIRTEPGELLAPGRFTPEAVEALKKQIGAIGNRNAQLGQEPTAGAGKIFKGEWWRFWDTLPPKFNFVCDFWDLTFDDEGQDPDYVAGQRWGVLGPDIYLIRRAPTLRRDLPDTIKAILAFRTVSDGPAYVPTACVIEKKANGAGVLKMLRKRVPGLIPYEPQGSKVERAAEASVWVESGNVYMPRNAQDLIDTAGSFPNVAHDDEIDAASMAINYLAAKRGSFGTAAAGLTFDEIAKKLGLL